VSTKISQSDLWPSLAYDEIMPTVDHIHRLAQIGAKYTLEQPFEPNWGNIVLPLTPRGFATRTLWCGDVTFVVDFNLFDDCVTVTASTGSVALPLAPGSVADFYARFVDAVAPLGIPRPRTTIESEIPNAPHLDADREQRPYDPAAARQAWAAMASAARALTEWQSCFRGPRLPVGIMWGGFDVYAARFNGRTVKPPSEAPIFQQNGMSSEVVAVGFYFGDERSRTPTFFAYISPPPDGMTTADFGVIGAGYDAQARLILLPWEIVRKSDDPRATVLTFADAVYDVAVKLGGWPTELVGQRHDGWFASSHSLVKS
jgi:hypothetical protein